MNSRAGFTVRDCHWQYGLRGRDMKGSVLTIDTFVNRGQGQMLALVEAVEKVRGCGRDSLR